MSKLISLMAVALLCMVGCDPCCYAQLKVDVTPIKLITGLTNPTLAGPYVLIDDKSTPQTATGAIVSVSTGAKQYGTVRVQGETIPTLEPVELTRIDSNNYLVLTPGVHRIEVFASDPGFDMVRVRVTVGAAPTPNPPTPNPPTPTPPGPGPSDIGNAYNIGLAAYQNAPADPGHAKAYAKIYRDAANFLYGIPSYKFIVSDNEAHARDPNRSVTAWLDREMALIKCVDQAKCAQWGTWRTKVAAAFVDSQKARGSYTREDWFQAFNEVAAALEKVGKQ